MLTAGLAHRFEVVVMVKRSQGILAGRSRRMSRHHIPSKLGISKIIKQFNIGDKVVISPKGNVKDIPHPRYRGRVGIVVEKRGGAYVVEVKLSPRITRILIVPQLHLEKAA